MKPYIIAYAATLIAFFAIDMIWLGSVAKDFYAAQLGDRLGGPRWGVAIGFYCLYIAGIVLFAVKPGIETGSVMTAAMWGALFGFFCYATYDLTNLATLKDWPAKVALVDIPWGTFLTASCAAAGAWAALKFT